MYTNSASELRENFFRGECSAVSIAETYLQRIKTYDKDIGAFLSVLNDRALEKADALDKKRSAGKPCGKLAGVPIAVKDNIHIRGERTTCASKFLDNYTAIFDSTAVRLLEQEDAIIIGKTNLDEFAMGSSNEHSAMQKTQNPWNLKYSPGGSSGGSAAAVAARMCPISIGSDTGGSIRQPASFCGILALKPTYGRISRYGLVAFGSSLDQIGPMATNTKDIAIAMEVLCQHCSHDATSFPEPLGNISSGMRSNLNGIRVGIPWHFLEGATDEVRNNFKKAVDTMKDLGAEIIDINLDILKYSIAVYYVLATAEASTNLARFDGIRYGRRSPDATTLDEIYGLSKDENFGPEVKRRIFLGTYVLSSGFSNDYYKKAQKVRTLIINKYKESFKYCDIVAMPTSPSSAFEIGAIHDPLQMYLSDIYTISANLAGLPSMNVPSGFSTDNMPIGLQLIGPQLGDAKVCSIAHAYEQATQYNKAIPKLVK